MDALLIAAWLGDAGSTLPVIDEASVSVARERVREVGRAALVPQLVIERAAVVASELGHNHLAHARFGEIAVRPVARDGVPGIEVVAADRGPGIADPAGAFAPERRSSGSLGVGLASVRRMSDEVDVDVRLGEGTCIRARTFARPVRRRLEIGVMSRPFGGERVSGDAVGFVRTDRGLLIAMADGLGHGPLAREASVPAVRAALGSASPRLAIEAASRAARGTRGAVMSVVALDEEAGAVEHASIGNVTLRIFARGNSRSFSGTSFILGVPSRGPLRMAEERAAFAPGEVIAIFTDGLSSRASAASDPVLLREAPIVIAQRLLEGFGKTSDDVMVLVCR